MVLVQNQGISYKGGNINGQRTWKQGKLGMEKHEYVNGRRNLITETFKGIDSYLLKYGIQEMLFENQEVIDRIINGVK